MNKGILAECENSVSISFEEYPLTVREAAKFLGVSPQTVCLWVERRFELSVASTH
jgi:hypothetical protein